MQKRLVTATDIRQASRSGQKSLLVPSDECIVTPMARDEAEELGILLNEDPKNEDPKTVSAPCEDTTCPPTPTAKSEELVKTVSDRIKTKGTPGVSEQQLEAVVRQVIASKLGSVVDQKSPDKPPPAVSDNQGIHFVDAERMLQESDALSRMSEKMLVVGAIGGKNGEKLVGGYMAWDSATFSRVVEEPEIAIVIEGELHLVIDGETRVCRTGDMIYFPKGAGVDYHAPGKVKLACVNFVGSKKN